MSITIKDIAKLANVSHTTVSRALNNSPNINEETKTKILSIAKELNYIPNFSAKSLVLHKSYNIGLFFSTLNQGTSQGFFYDSFIGVNDVIGEKYNLLVKGIDNYKKINYIDNKRLDGIILISQSDSDNFFIYETVKKGIPIVVLNREIQDESIANILSGEKKGAFDATEYLIKCGHKHIAIIKGKKGFKSTIDRKDGFVKALIMHEIPIKNEYMVDGEYDTRSGYIAMNELLALEKIPTAVFCSNDDMAVGAMKSIFEAGLKVPEDISIIGFDDNLVCSYVTPTLTTIKKPITDVSKIGAEILLNLIEGRDVKIEKKYIDTTLIIRESVKRLNEEDNYEVK